MSFTATEFPGLLIFQPRVFEDSRGYFFESFNEKICQEAGLDIRFVQDNQAKSMYGVVRGLHYQKGKSAQTKFIRVLSGAILDVVLDIRKGSPTFGKTFSIELSAENKTQLLVPKGFAHGYSVISESAEVFYKCDAFYDVQSEAGVHYKDADLAIDWKIPGDKQIVSDKDLILPRFSEGLSDFEFTSA